MVNQQRLAWAQKVVPRCNYTHSCEEQHENENSLPECIFRSRRKLLVQHIPRDGLRFHRTLEGQSLHTPAIFFDPGSSSRIVLNTWCRRNCLHNEDPRHIKLSNFGDYHEGKISFRIPVAFFESRNPNIRRS